MRMLQSSSKLLESGQHHCLLLQPLRSNATPPPLSTHTCCKLSRRQLAIFTNSSLLLASYQALLPAISAAHQQQEENAGPAEVDQENEAATAAAAAAEQASPQETVVPPQCINDDDSKPPTRQAFLDVSIDGEPAGRIIVGIYENSVPLGASRFMNLVSGRAGISYRRKEFVKIMPGYVQHGGVRSYGVDAELGWIDLKNNALKQEWEKAKGECPGPRNLEGRVSIVVRDPSKPPPKVKLVAREGKLEMDEEEVGVEPNGTQFLIFTKDSPELDDSALVIGKVVQGMDVVRTIAHLKTVQDNTTSPYFRVAKLIGDKRAVVAERGFNRPYSKVLVTNCGLLE